MPLVDILLQLTLGHVVGIARRDGEGPVHLNMVSLSGVGLKEIHLRGLLDKVRLSKDLAPFQSRGHQLVGLKQDLLGYAGI